jgi:hypothetical protein
LVESLVMQIVTYLAYAEYRYLHVGPRFEVGLVVSHTLFASRRDRNIFSFIQNIISITSVSLFTINYDYKPNTCDLYFSNSSV